MRLIISAATLTLFISSAALAELPSASSTAIHQALASGRPTLLDLGARSCTSCKKMAPILETLAAEHRSKANVLFIDVNEDRDAAKRFRIQMIPTQIFFDAAGKEVKRHVGVMERAEIIKELKALGGK